MAGRGRSWAGIFVLALVACQGGGAGTDAASERTFGEEVLATLRQAVAGKGKGNNNGKGGGNNGDGGTPGNPGQPPPVGAGCASTVTADVVVLDQPLMFNRLGAQNINGMVYALRRDVINVDTGLPLTKGGAAVAGQVALRPDKRPRPITLRVAEGGCLVVHLENLLTAAANPRNAPLDRGGLLFNLQINDQVAGRVVGFHPQGLELVGGIGSDSSFVGQNPNSLVAPGQSATYQFRAPREGAFLVTNPGASFGGEGSAGNAPGGLFGAVNVEPPGARFYRSQLTEEELRLATLDHTSTQQPILDYAAVYPDDCPNGVWCKEGKAGLPILAMVDANGELVHADVNAVIVGPNADGTFPASTYPLESVGRLNPTVPNRLEPFREFTVVFHDETAASQAFPGYFEDPVFQHTLHGVRDSFMVNYGSGGIGAEIVANRLEVGPMHDCVDCQYEEFFLSSFTVGDPAMLVDVPANMGLEAVAPGVPSPAGAAGPKATRAFFPDDPGNVHHAYTGDAVRFRNVHVGKEQHVFHLHNHQWLFNPSDDDSNYIDAQGIGPGSSYTYEINFGGAGNRNKTAGDAIFHCHFYPHFAQGMWELFRVHDTLETGTRLQVSNGEFHATPFALQDGTPAAGARALPDGEIVAGTPIPAVVPLPGRPMAPMPGRVEVAANALTTTASSFHALTPNAEVPVGSVAKVIDRDENPGFPFWVAGIEDVVGQRGATPPLDMLTETEAAALQAGSNPLFAGRTDLVPNAGGFDGGLPRHALLGKAAGGVAASTVSRLDFSKRILRAKPVYYPEEGTDVEQAAMAFHARRTHPSFALSLDGTASPADFVTNGQKPNPSAPYHEPCIDDLGELVEPGRIGGYMDGHGGYTTSGPVTYGASNPRTYKAAAIQVDVTFNKAGYHYPQERIVTLWEDVAPTMSKERAPEPFVIRFNTYDCGKYLHTNLVPEAIELDDFQIRTPTDIIGQHIHLPKWDLTSTDGAANGWNYEDGTLAPGALRERIHAINEWNADAPPDQKVATLDGRTVLAAEAHPFFGAGPGGSWLGARTTLQRWFFDPVVNSEGVDRGLGVIFTHDHYGPSTHQQIGLYGSVLVEPAGSSWVHNETGTPFHTRDDGGPTSWQAAILTGDLDQDGADDSYREFWFQATDFQHAYQAGVYVGAGPDGRPNAALAPTADTFRDAINPPARAQANPLLPDLVRTRADCPGGQPRPCPEAISAEDPGMFVVNYRNEPVGLRVFDPARPGPDGKPGSQAEGLAGDLAFALQSRTDRVLAPLNTVNGLAPYAPLTSGLSDGDPFTPMMRAFAGDKVRVRVQMGGQEEEFATSIHGVKWLQGGSSFGSAKNSGWRNNQAHGISEQFTFEVPVVPFVNQPGSQADHAYSMNAAQDGWWTGVWGLMRAYNAPRNDLFRLPATQVPLQISNPKDFNGVCPRNARVRRYDVSAVLANRVLGNDLGVTVAPGAPWSTQHVGGPVDPAGGTLVYNPRDTALTDGHAGPLHDPTGLLYVHTADLDPSGKLRAGVPVEPLVLRAAAGECVEVTLRNRLPEVLPELANLTTLIPVVRRDRNAPNGVTWFDNNLIRASSHVGLHPQLVAYDAVRADGHVVGANPPGLGVVAPGDQQTVRWYAGDLSVGTIRGGGKGRGSAARAALVATPIEFGGANLMPADVIKQGQKGLGGALVVLPPNATWTQDAGTRAAATVNGSMRDFALVTQKQMSHRYADGASVPNLAADLSLVGEDSQDSGQMAFNYRTEPMWFRFGLRANAPLGNVAGGLGAVPNPELAHANVLSGGDPVTPVFTVPVGREARLHLVEPHGGFRGSSFNLHGHAWQRDPYVCPGSSHLGLAGKCRPNEVGSRGLGYNPVGLWVGGQEGLQPATHFDLLLPSAGGAGAVPGDYLFRDQAGFGNLAGLWGILRVTP